MRRRRKDPVMQKLRRLARSGNRSEAAALLEEALRNNPRHAGARDELARYLTNRPFSFEEAEYAELQQLLADFLSNPQEINTRRSTALKRLYQRVTRMQQDLEHLLSTTERNTLRQLCMAATRELQRRRQPASGRILAAAAGIGILLVLGGGSFFLWQRAAAAADTLETAAEQQLRRSQALNLLKIHDTGLNRTMNRRVSAAADKLRASLAARQTRIHELDTTLSLIEQGKQTVVGQGVRRRAAIERRLRELGGDAAPLRARWAELCRREQKELDQQRLSLAEELMAPLPPGEKLTGEPAKDVQLLKNRRKVLQQRQSIFDDAGNTLGLPASLIAPVQQELQQLEKLLHEAQAFTHTLQLLPAAHDYERYRQLLDTIQATHYIHAAELLEVRRLMPQVNNLRGMMQEHGQNVPAGLLRAARESLIDGGPTFTTDFPATKEQLHLLDELLTNSALRTRLIELTDKENQVAYSEEPPVIRHGRVHFTRSTLDPLHNVSGNNKMEWLNPHAVWQRILDPRAIHRRLNLGNRTGFASTANIPSLITGLMQMEENEVPVLAKAYVLHHLLQVNAASAHEIMSGMRFAPAMRQAAETFEKLRNECGIELDGNCWLRHSDNHARSEQQFARWFSRHRKLDFAAELKSNLGSLLRITPRFCGYVNESGQPVLFEEPRTGQLIWYLSGTSMTTSPWGSPLQAPRCLSPIFSMEKAF